MPTDSHDYFKIVGRKDSKASDARIDLNDPSTFRPQMMEKHAASLWPYAVMRGWMTKHMPPAFSFTKSYHRRYILLIDRIIYTFKTDTPKNDYREFFELTPNTCVFATDLFPGIMYCLEIRRKEDGRTWYLQAESVEDMKAWMNVIKKAIQWLNLQLPGVFSLTQLLAMEHPVDRPASTVWHLPQGLPPQRPPPTTLPPPPPLHPSIYPL
ncbi:hypothetical protein BX666DRAFT_1431931 [Dichotomocladium elegans]|nr:hypothetical protein BX666DRAFT_1431931 [Dichotomocladium elegans]